MSASLSRLGEQTESFTWNLPTAPWDPLTSDMEMRRNGQWCLEGGGVELR